MEWINMESRKSDHIDLAFSSQLERQLADDRFDYEPMLGGSLPAGWEPFPFLGKTLRLPMWVSSMTGGTAAARTINANLARACREFGMGMGLGSCRILMKDRRHLPDFDVRGIIGDELPLYANIGIAQLEEILEEKATDRIDELVSLLRADGIIVHVNPLQEWLQDEGDPIRRPPVDTLEEFLSVTGQKVIVKEVGQGMGPGSVRRVMRLPVDAFEFAAFGGTNFSKVELNRSNPQKQQTYESLARIGHTATAMLQTVNQLDDIRCRSLIISGGIRDFLDGYYHISLSKLPALFGQASGFLRHARGEYAALQQYVEYQVRGLLFARAWLKPRQPS